MDALIAPLRRVELFQGLSPLQITEIARTAERIVFKAGSRIAEAGRDADAALLIVAGDADVVADTVSACLPQPIEEASLIGEMAMLVEHTFGVTVVARTSVRCLKINRDVLRDIILDDPEVGEKLSANLAGRLNRVADELRDIDGVLADVLPGDGGAAMAGQGEGAVH